MPRGLAGATSTPPEPKNQAKSNCEGYLDVSRAQTPGHEVSQQSRVAGGGQERAGLDEGEVVCCEAAQPQRMP